MNLLLRIKGKFTYYLESLLCVYKIKKSQSVFLTFDDGPEPSITEFVLDCLKKYNAKATFFCLGKNIEIYPQLYNQILEEGHIIGSHTMSHLKGDETPVDNYCEEVRLFIEKFGTRLFRPPHGILTIMQLIKVRKIVGKSNIIMWSNDSTDWYHTRPSDFDIEDIVSSIRPGSIVLLHCCNKHEKRTRAILPILLNKLASKNLVFESIK